MIKIKTIANCMLPMFPKVDEVTFITDNLKGLTIAFFRLDRMIFVSIAWCAPEDTFSRKTGRNVVSDRIVNGQGIFLPLGDFDDKRIVPILINMFNGIGPEDIPKLNYGY